MKKILVRAPEKEEDIILSFPFMHALKEEFPQDQINVIAPEGIHDLYGFLPFELAIHPFPIKNNTLPGIHHYAYNLHDVFNIDIYFDLIDDFKSAFMGFAFRSKIRMGSDEGMKRYLLTKRLPPKFYSSVDQKSLELLQAHTSNDYSSLKVLGTEVSLLKGAMAPYLLFLVDDFKGDENRRKLLKLFIESFESQKMIFWNFETEDYEEMEIRQQFFASLAENNLGRNQFEFLKSANYKHLTQLLLAAKGVFTDESWKARLGAYFGVDVFYWGSKTLSPSTYFKFSPSTLIMKTDKVGLLGMNEEKTFESIDSLVDHLHQLLVL